MSHRSTESNAAYAGFYPVIAPLIMCSGVGDGKTTACVMAQAATIDALRKGKTLDSPTDEMECACPLLRRMAIQANDANWWASNKERTEHLRPLIPLLLDSRASVAVTRKRAARFTNAVIHELTPMRLKWIAQNTKNEKLAASCRDGINTIAGIKEVNSKASAEKARAKLDELKSSASAYAYADASASASASASAYASAYASASAYAYADASADAYASASASASAYAYADASADAYADAYADASADAYAYADAYAQKLRYRTACLDLFRELAAIKG